MSTGDIVSSRIPRTLSYPLSLIASVALLAAGCALIYSLAGILFTTGRDSMLWSIFAFLTTAFLAVYASVCRPMPLAAIWRGFAVIGQLLGSIGRACFVMAVVGVLLTLAGCAHGTVPPYDDLPIFARRPQYLLMGGVAGYFEVSRIAISCRQQALPWGGIVVL